MKVKSVIIRNFSMGIYMGLERMVYIHTNIYLALNFFSSKKFIVIFFSENCEKMTELAEKKKNDILPMLKRSSAIATDALKECLELEELSNSW